MKPIMWLLSSTGDNLTHKTKYYLFNIIKQRKAKQDRLLCEIVLIQDDYIILYRCTTTIILRTRSAKTNPKFGHFALNVKFYVGGYWAYSMSFYCLWSIPLLPSNNRHKYFKGKNKKNMLFQASPVHKKGACLQCGHCVACT